MYFNEKILKMARNIRWSWSGEWSKRHMFFGPKSVILKHITYDDINGSVGSIADLKPKGPGFESRISQGFFLM
jgi:hypothetical protein